MVDGLKGELLLILHILFIYFCVCLFVSCSCIIELFLVSIYACFTLAKNEKFSFFKTLCLLAFHSKLSLSFSLSLSSYKLFVICNSKDCISHPSWF